MEVKQRSTALKDTNVSKEMSFLQFLPVYSGTSTHPLDSVPVFTRASIEMCTGLCNCCFVGQEVQGLSRDT